MPKTKKQEEIKQHVAPKVTTLDIITRFEQFGTLVNEDKADLTRSVEASWIQRGGLELAGLVKAGEHAEAIMGWGTKERKFLEKLTASEIRDRVSNALNRSTPLIVLSKGFNNKKVFDQVIKIANQYNIPVANSKYHLSEINSFVSAFLLEKQAEVVSIHASLAIINGVGVMIKGPSGIGKSEALIELLQKGHAFVSDDTVELWRMGEIFYGRPAALTEGLLEARGIGLINVPFIYGARAVKKQTTVELVVELLPEEKQNELDRLGNKDLKFEALKRTIPLIQIPAASGRSTAALIEAATNVYLARTAGMDPLALIAERNRKI